MHKELTTAPSAVTQDVDGELGEVDLRLGARVGDVRIRRPRAQRRGVLHVLRGVPRAIRRAAHLG
jgi:hypothetical protein